MSKVISGVISRTLAVSILATGISVLAASQTPAEAQDASAKATSAAALSATLSQRGRVSVIVRLSGQFQPEQGLAGPEGVEASAAVAAQRAMIGQAQTRVLSGLAGTDVQTVKRFKYTPLMSMSVDGPGLDALVNSPDVIGIQEDRPQPPTLFQSVPLIGGDVFTGFALGPDKYSGAGQTVAILDTGVYSGHPFLAGKVVSEACFSTNNAAYNSTSVCPGGLTESTAPGSGGACSLIVEGCDHGTHVAGIAAGWSTNIAGNQYSGVAKDATILAIQVFSRFDDAPGNGFICAASGLPSPCALTFNSDQIKGLERVYELRSTYSIAAANMSLGGGYHVGFCNNDLRKPVIDLLRAEGIATAIASGNSGFENGVGDPACISSAVTVGSSTKTDGISFFSNNSFVVDVLAPGSAIGSSVPFIAYESWNGTSMAAPHVAGAFAVLKSHKPTASVSELESALKSTGTYLSETRSGVFFSKPRINVDLALGYAPSTSSDYVAGDFNADTMSDILFRNSGNGGTVIWQMNGLTKQSSAGIGNPPLAWRIEDVSDSNGDGRGDILWRHTGTGSVVIWQMDGFVKSDSASIGNVSTTWRVAGHGDFDGDNKTDILWHNSITGSVVIWLMDEFVKLNAEEVGAPATVWQVVGVGDFNGDSMSDILWRRNDGSLVVWEMNGLVKAAGVTLPAPPSVWLVEGVADFDGNGQPDILFRHAGDHRVVIWQMDGYTKVASGWVGTVSGAWQVVRLGDHNGDGLADILWNKPGTGDIVIWEMNALVRETAGLVDSAPGWVAQ